MKLFLKIVAWLIGLIALFVIGMIITFNISVKPGVYIIQKMFDAPVEVIDKMRYEDASQQVKVEKDITYLSNYEENTLDIFYPKDVDGPVPILFWMHGGGYVGGNKEGVAEFATYIADANKIAVVAMNYEKAPNLQYPGQLKQLEEVYTFCKQIIRIIRC